MINININNQYAQLFSENLLSKYCMHTLAHFNLSNDDLTVVIETDQFIRKLNKQYRDIDQATDVLSFNIDYLDPETGRKYLGDIVISGDTVARNAITNSVTLLEETRLLIVHGILHLLGYDHSSIEEEKEMWALQNEIIEKITFSSIDNDS